MDAREQICALIESLRSCAPLEPRGIALARLLVRDSRSPLFYPCSDRRLRDALSEVAVALAPRNDTAAAGSASALVSSRNLDGGAPDLHVAFTDLRLR
jgi:hypothetical protein